jgi:hypothetical protein
MSLSSNRLPHVAVAVLAALVLLPIGQHAAFAAAAKRNHHDAKQLLGDKAKKDGNHVVDRKGPYTVSFDTKGGKIADAHVRHATKGEIPVKKYKTNKKMAMTGAHLTYASLKLIPTQYETTGYIGYSYIDDDGNEEIYWVPATMVIDPDTGAVEYVESD